jgi:post-segregation antitoxin (ccd killing protein)
MLSVMTRPALMDDQHELHVVIPRELRGQMLEAARRADLKLSQWVRRAMREQLKREASE